MVRILLPPLRPGFSDAVTKCQMSNETGGKISGTLVNIGQDDQMNRQWCTHFVGVGSI